MSDAPENWLQNLKVGDPVIVETYDTERIATVSHATKCFLTVDNMRFNRTSGQRVNTDSWHSRWLTFASPAKVAEIRQREARDGLIYHISSMLNRQLLMSASTERLRQLKNLLDEITADGSSKQEGQQ